MVASASSMSARVALYEPTYMTMSCMPVRQVQARRLAPACRYRSRARSYSVLARVNRCAALAWRAAASSTSARLSVAARVEAAACGTSPAACSAAATVAAAAASSTCRDARAAARSGAPPMSTAPADAAPAGAAQASTVRSKATGKMSVVHHRCVLFAWSGHVLVDDASIAASPCSTRVKCGRASGGGRALL